VLGVECTKLSGQHPQPAQPTTRSFRLQKLGQFLCYKELQDDNYRIHSNPPRRRIRFLQEESPHGCWPFDCWPFFGLWPFGWYETLNERKYINGDGNIVTDVTDADDLKMIGRLILTSGTSAATEFRRQHCSTCGDVETNCSGGYFNRLAPEVCA